MNRAVKSFNWAALDYNLRWGWVFVFYSGALLLRRFFKIFKDFVKLMIDMLIFVF